MTQEDKDLLLIDLCARLPYGVITRSEFEEYEDGKCVVHYTDLPLVRKNSDGWDIITLLSYGIVKYKMKPYLRPMSSMTEEEYNELKEFESYYGIPPIEVIDDWAPNYEVIDWLNEHHFDYRGLIGKGLALPAPEGMYND